MVQLKGRNAICPVNLCGFQYLMVQLKGGLQAVCGVRQDAFQYLMVQLKVISAVD